MWPNTSTTPCYHQFLIHLYQFCNISFFSSVVKLAHNKYVANHKIRADKKYVSCENFLDFLYMTCIWSGQTLNISLKVDIVLKICTFVRRLRKKFASKCNKIKRNLIMAYICTSYAYSYSFQLRYIFRYTHTEYVFHFTKLDLHYFYLVSISK